MEKTFADIRVGHKLYWGAIGMDHISDTIGTKWMNNGIINKNVPNDDVENYLKNGWVLGMKRKNK